MSFYDLISKRLLEAGIYFEPTELADTAVIEYMVFEKANCLHNACYKPLPGGFSQIIDLDNPESWGQTSGMNLESVTPHPSFEHLLSMSEVKGEMKDGFWEPNERGWQTRSVFNFSSQITSSKHKQEFQLTLMKFFDHFTAVTLPAIGGVWPFNFYLFNNEIARAIKTSTLYLAAGRLEDVGTRDLIRLQKNLKHYKDCFVGSNIITQLQARIGRHPDYPNKEKIKRCSAVLQKESEWREALYEQELRFNKSFLQLGKKLSELIQKAERSQPEYAGISKVALTLRDKLIHARKAFFANPTKLQLSVFKARCEEHINNAKEEFAKYRQKGAWYSELCPFIRDLFDCCRALLGIVAGLTVIPALLVDAYSPFGYLGTFFQRPQTDSLQKLESFEQQIIGEGGVVDELDKLKWFNG